MVYNFALCLGGGMGRACPTVNHGDYKGIWRETHRSTYDFLSNATGVGIHQSKCTRPIMLFDGAAPVRRKTMQRFPIAVSSVTNFVYVCSRTNKVCVRANCVCVARGVWTVVWPCFGQRWDQDFRCDLNVCAAAYATVVG